jgi:hypothetical protein
VARSRCSAKFVGAENFTKLKFYCSIKNIDANMFEIAMNLNSQNLGIYGITLLYILLYKLKLIYIINNTTIYFIEK